MTDRPGQAEGRPPQEGGLGREPEEEALRQRPEWKESRPPGRESPAWLGQGQGARPSRPRRRGVQLKEQGFPAGLAGPGLCPWATSVAQQRLERLWDQRLYTSRAGRQFSFHSQPSPTACTRTHTCVVTSLQPPRCPGSGQGPPEGRRESVRPSAPPTAAHTEPCSSPKVCGLVLTGLSIKLQKP